MGMLKSAKTLAKPLLSALSASTLYFVKTGLEYKTDIYLSNASGTNILDVSTERLRSDTVKKYSPQFNPLVLALAYKDNVTTINAGVGVAYLRSPRSFILRHLRASVFIPSTTTAIEVVVKVNGTNIVPGVTLSIDGSETSSLTAVVDYNSYLPVNGILINNDDIISLDVVNAGTDATGLQVQLHEGVDNTFSYVA